MNEKLDTRFMHPREQLVVIINRIYHRGLTTTSGGNISMIDENGDIWVTPSAVDKGSLQERDIMCVKKDGTIIGPHKPSSEFPFHRAIYKMRPDIRAIVHAHPPALVSFSIARKIPDTNVIAQAKNICGPIGYAAYELPGSEDLGALIGKEFKKGFKAVIMENHGPVVGGSDMGEAFQRFETLEFCAHSSLLGQRLGQTKHLNDQQIDIFQSQKAFSIPESTKVNYPPDETEKRTEICRIVNRACMQGLMISSYGTVSMRWQENDFLITPTNKQRWDLLPDDVVQIKNGQREPGKIPSRSVYLHMEIYKRFPHINSVIITQPPNLMAYGITHSQINVRTIPESWIFLQDMPNIPYGSQFDDFKGVIEVLEQNKPAMILQNDAVLVTGDALLQTFDRLEVAEFSAKSLVMGTTLGELIPINDEQVEALRRKFLG